MTNDDFSEKAIQAIVNADIRRAFANVVLQIRDKEAEAVSHIEALLDRCG